MTFKELIDLFAKIETEGKKVTHICLNKKDYIKLPIRMAFVNETSKNFFMGAEIELITDRQSYLYTSSLDGTDRGKRIYEIDLCSNAIKDAQGRITQISHDLLISTGHCVCTTCNKDIPKVWDTVCFTCGKTLCHQCSYIINEKWYCLECKSNFKNKMSFVINH